MIRAAHNNTVTVKYTGKLADGTIFDASPEDSPLQFIIGRGEVIKGFEAAVLNMAQGEVKTVVIEPDQAYGASKPELIEEIKRAALPDNVELVEGRQLEVTQGDGSLLLLMINKVTEETVTLDANHPLAGKTLTFEIEMLDVNTDPPKELPPLFSAALEGGPLH
ncbi:peptidylprolyl isomerase [Malonomonas rubra DSM 5091]|uniref:Peptidyl-prolyl cis-trans isomerase n=1 Tax=Malonomonas rubra DSM 5091 TaxID=1122189 RepID=A0A1M6FJS5_MALRU|nr:peptidylprolyl isomerase [Malonomonas rubra]SHI97879.1 peptidylprolyl isomerase [Malonomonas rubra DSM 5091]